MLDSKFGNSNIKNIIKNIFNLLFDYVPDDFIEYVSINNSEVEFFRYKTLSPE